jgi:hypothetical protein
MSVFQHPHLTRGIVKTAKGAFIVSRGLVDMPDELGESLGWQPIDPDADTSIDVAQPPSPASGVSDQHSASRPALMKTVERENQIVEGARRRSPGLKKPTK